MSAPSIHSGGMLGRYRLVEQIGAGGMGVVYRAHDERLDRDVAIKLLNPGSIRSAIARHRVRNEALALSRLSHPNIETIFEFDTLNDCDFLVVELIPGASLDELLNRGPLPQTLAVSLTIQLLRGLAAAHEKGIIHRDLKPSNLRLTQDSFLKILDFGLAHIHDEEEPEKHNLTTETHSTVLSGTLAYMSPEQLRGARLDPRSDIYAAGLVLYQMCTGRLPFTESGAMLIDAVLNKSIPPPRRVKRDIAPDLEAVILKALEKDPKRRYQSAREMLRDLEAIAASGRAMRLIMSRRISTAVLAIGLLFVVTLVATNLPNITKQFAALTNQRAIESLAVLPFENLSHDPDQDYMADGMTDALIASLGEIRGLERVISHSSVMRYKAERRPVTDVAKELNVDAVVQGTILRSGSFVVVVPRLFNASGKQIWSRSYQRELRDLVSLQRELTLAITTESNIHLLSTEQARLQSPSPVNPAAQVAFLRGNYLKFGSTAQQEKAKEYFEQAISIDPSYAPAYTGLADYYSHSQLRPLEAMPKAEQYALKALSLDPTLAQAHVSLASVRFYADWNWAEAEKEVKRAIELNPSDADAHHMYSVFLSAMGRHTEAEAEVKRALDLDPLNLWTQIAAGFVYYFAHRYDSAIQQCHKVLELDPNSAGGNDCLGSAYLAKGDYQEAITACERAVRFSGNDPTRAACIGRAYASAGRTQEARKILDALRRESEQTYVPPYFLAQISISLGDRGEGMTWLEESFRERDIYIAWLKVDSALDAVRSTPRFQTLLQQMSFPAGNATLPRGN